MGKKKFFVFFAVSLLLFGCAGRQKQNLAEMYKAATVLEQDEQKDLIPAPTKSEPHYSNSFSNTPSEDAIASLSRLNGICIKKLSKVAGIINGDFNAPASELFQAIVQNSKCDSKECDFSFGDGNCYLIGPFDAPEFMRVESLGVYDDAKTFLQVIPDELKTHLRIKDAHTLNLTAPKRKIDELKELFQKYNQRPRKVAVEITVEAITIEDLQNFGISTGNLAGFWEWAEGETSSFEGTTSLLSASLPGKLQMLMQKTKSHLLKHQLLVTSAGRKVSLLTDINQHFRLEGDKYDRIDKVGIQDKITITPYLQNESQILLSCDAKVGEMGNKTTADNLPQTIQREIISDEFILEKGKKSLVGITFGFIKRDSKEGIPYLGKIPLIFSSKSKNYEEALLLIFITCYF